MTITRAQPNGKKCKEKYCKDIQVEEEGFVDAYPNPVTNLLYLSIQEMEFEGMVEIEIIDSNNRICESFTTGMSDAQITSLDLSNLKSGVYIVRMQMKDKIHTKRILLIR